MGGSERMNPLAIREDFSVEEIYKIIREMPAEKQSELINKLLEGTGLIAIMSNGCVTGNTINVGAKYEKLAQQVEDIASELRALKNSRHL